MLRTSGRGKGSGVNVEQRNWTVWTFVDSKIARIDSYMNRTEAVEAVGLPEQDAHADSSSLESSQ